MKKIVTTLVVLGSLTLGFSYETVAVQIEAIQNAPEQERVELMNEFKQNLASMNEVDRAAAINEMHIKTQEEHSSSSHILGEHNSAESHIIHSEGTHSSSEMHGSSHSENESHVNSSSHGERENGHSQNTQMQHTN